MKRRDYYEATTAEKKIKTKASGNIGLKKKEKGAYRISKASGRSPGETKNEQFRLLLQCLAYHEDRSPSSGRKKERRKA